MFVTLIAAAANDWTVHLYCKSRVEPEILDKNAPTFEVVTDGLQKIKFWSITFEIVTEGLKKIKF